MLKFTQTGKYIMRANITIQMTKINIDNISNPVSYAKYYFAFKCAYYHFVLIISFIIQVIIDK